MPISPRDLARAVDQLVLRFPAAELHKNDVGNLTIMLDGKYVGWVDLRTAEVHVFADERGIDVSDQPSEWIEIAGQRFTPDEVRQLLEAGASPFLLAEAIASTALDRDGEVTTRFAPSEYICPWCGATTRHPNDIASKYCPRCHEFEDQRRAREELLTDEEASE